MQDEYTPAHNGTDAPSPHEKTDDQHDRAHYRRVARDVKKAAKREIAQGRHVVPLKPNMKVPVTPEWQHRRYTETDVDVDHAFTDEGNIGVLTGEPSGDMIDIDLDSMTAVRLAKHFLPKTNAIFGRPGKPNSHWLYVAPGNSEAPELQRLRSVKFEDIPGGCGVIAEIRVDGRMTMIPPSIHPTGELLTGSTENPATTDAETLGKAMAYLATACLIGENWERLRAQHHDFTLALAGGLAKSGVPVDEAELLLRAVLIDVGDHEVESRLRNLRDTYRKYDNGEAVTGWTTVAEYLDPKRMFRIRNDWLKTKSKDFSFTDEGNAQRLILRFGHRIRYVHAQKAWFVWDGSRWRQDDNETVLGFARETVVALAELADATDNRKLKSWSMTSRNLSRIRAMVDLARTDDSVKFTPDVLDANPWLLNVANGTLNLRTGACQPHDRDDFITKKANVTWSRTAPCPLWLQTITAICSGDVERVAFLQRWLGYSLTGSTQEQVVLLMHGPGGNGKTTIIETMIAILGDYALKMASSTFMRRNDSTASYDMARMPGIRFVALNEIGDGGSWNEELIKDVSGSDTITARAPYGQFISYRPIAKVTSYGNSRPSISGTDDGIWRRIMVLLLNARFTGDDPTAPQIKDLQTVLRSEYPGILRWLVEGCLEWQRDGLNPPESVKEANRSYRSGMDTLGAWMDDRCVIEGRDVPKISTVTTDDLHRDYVSWMAATGDQHLGSRKFGERLDALGFETSKSHGRRIRPRIGLLEPEQGSPFAGPRTAYTPRPKGAAA